MASVRDVTDATFNKEVLGSTLPVLVDFWAPWCGPCRMVSPLVEELAGDFAGKMDFVKLNTDESPATAMSIAGKPLSQVATPSTPARNGRERASRRNSMAASFRYGRLSNMPAVPWVRPSQGSEQKPATGMAWSRRNSWAAACTSRPSSQ